MYYSAIGLLAALILIIENQDILFKRSDAFNQKTWTVYRRFLISVLIFYATDILWGVIESHKLPLLLFIDTTVYFIATASCIVLWSAYVYYYLDEKNSFGRVVMYTGRIIAAFIVALTVINIFIPVIFKIDENCVYEALPVRHAMIAGQIGILLLISVYALTAISRNKETAGQAQWRRHRTIALFGAVMALFMIIQLWFPYLPLYAIALMLGICLLRAFVIGDEKEQFRVDLEEAKKIADLKKTITSLLDNMPAMSFSKDAGTGVYLACNQAFARYARKDSPEGVIGLTDAQIFDAETAAHFVEDDRKAIEMDKPYVFMESVPDAAGDLRQIQTTKLKYIDDAGRLCVLGMGQDITELVRIQRENEYVKEKQSAFRRINALAGDFLCIYSIIPETGFYREFSTADSFRSFEMPAKGDNFLEDFRLHCRKLICPEDADRFLEVFTMENIKAEISQNGIFATNCRMSVGGEMRCVQVKAAIVQEDEGKRLIIGLNDIEALVRQEEEFAARLSQAQRKANIDALTGVKTKHAYLEMEERLDNMIADRRHTLFAIVIIDINDLKFVNDTQGHKAGDQYIKDACKTVCETFKHSPVYRVGGDEFAVVSQGEDYENIDGLIENVKRHNEEAAKNGGIIIAAGMARFDGDDCVAAVYERADIAMYENKRFLKEGRGVR